MSDEVGSILLGTAGLTVALLAAAALTVLRGGVSASDVDVRTAARVAAVLLLLQAAHFAEELATGFHRRFPETLGLAAWSTGFFVSFNVAWLVVWWLAIGGLIWRRRLALVPLWFLGIAGLANGIAHPALALRAGGYFPGLLTSPFVGVAGALLLQRLGAITGRSAAA